MEEVNEIDVEETLQEIQSNESSLTHIILNNVVSTPFFILPLPNNMILNMCLVSRKYNKFKAIINPMMFYKFYTVMMTP